MIASKTKNSHQKTHMTVDKDSRKEGVEGRKGERKEGKKKGRKRGRDGGRRNTSNCCYS